jgi:hypothetical protein
MTLAEFGWLRPALAALLLIAGLLLRFGAVPAWLFRATALAAGDEDIRRRAFRRIGLLLILWALWVVMQMAAGVPESWLASVWAPAVVVAAAALSYPARLYTGRYLPPAVPCHPPRPRSSPFPRGVGGSGSSCARSFPLPPI